MNEYNYTTDELIDLPEDHLLHQADRYLLKEQREAFRQRILDLESMCDQLQQQLIKYEGYEE